MSEDHASLPVRLPSLDHLSNEELAALRARLAVVSRDARRKATQVISRHANLKKPWHRTLSMKKESSIAEREEALRDLELELLRVPEAFIAHAYANSLVQLDTACREEMSRRSLPVSTRRKEVEPKSAPPPPAEGLDVLSMIDAIDRQER